MLVNSKSEIITKPTSSESRVITHPLNGNIERLACRPAEMATKSSEE